MPMVPCRCTRRSRAMLEILVVALWVAAVFTQDLEDSASEEKETKEVGFAPSFKKNKGGSRKMEELQRAIELAIKEFKKEFGPDAKIEEGDKFVTVFNNCSLILSLENGKFKTEFVAGKPYQVDMTLSIYKEEEE